MGFFEGLFGKGKEIAGEGAIIENINTQLASILAHMGDMSDTELAELAPHVDGVVGALRGTDTIKEQ